MKCDELKPITVTDECGSYRVYNKSDVDAAIEELKAAHHKERHEYIEMVARLKAKLAEQEDNILNKKNINAFDCICVTDVRISLIKQIEGLTHTKALAEIVFNDQLLIRGIRVVEGKNGLYISYPFPFHPTTGEDGQPRSTVFPITKMLRDHVESVVLEKYQDIINNEKVTIK